MLLLFIICCENVDCDIYNVLYCLYMECKINLSIYAVQCDWWNVSGVCIIVCCSSMWLMKCQRSLYHGMLQFNVTDKMSAEFVSLYACQQSLYHCMLQFNVTDEMSVEFVSLYAAVQCDWWNVSGVCIIVCCSSMWVMKCQWSLYHCMLQFNVTDEMSAEFVSLYSAVKCDWWNVSGVCIIVCCSSMWVMKCQRSLYHGMLQFNVTDEMSAEFVSSLRTDTQITFSLHFTPLGIRLSALIP